MSLGFGPTFTYAIEALIATGGLTTTIYLVWMRPAVNNERRSAETLREQLTRDSELKVNSAELKARQDILDAKEKLEQEFKLRDERYCAKEESLESRREALQERENLVRAEQRALAEYRAAIDKRAGSIHEELQRISKLTKEQAREQLLKQTEAEFQDDILRQIKVAEEMAQEEVDRRAKQILLDTIERNTAHYVAEATQTMVELPSEDMKGRIIGREGRNIRSFEQVAGVDLIIDETPEAVVISSFDPIRREIARRALMNLMLDGRIHPTRIEELYKEAEENVNRTIVEAGERAAERAGVQGLPPRVIEILGKLQFRTSYAQNVLEHSIEVSMLCVSLATDLGLNIEVARRAGFLHDIGKALGSEWEGPHALTGMEFLKDNGEKEPVLIAVGAHHHDIEPNTAEAILVIIADTISASRPGARRESLENYFKRITSLEAIADSIPGVEKSYAIQAGREVRVIVKPEEVDDLKAKRIAKEVAKKIEKQHESHWQVKITVIREVRVQEVTH